MIDNVKLVEQYWAYMGSGAFDKASQCIAGDADVWFPNTREVFRGKDAFVAFNKQYPGKWSIEIEKIVAVNDTVVTAVRVVSQDGAMSFYAASFFTIAGGLIQEITEYWGENDEPPAWRQGSSFVERY